MKPASLEFQCGYAVNAILDKYRSANPPLPIWTDFVDQARVDHSSGALASQCGKVAVFVVVHMAGVFPYCTDCFLRDAAVANAADLILELDSATEEDLSALRKRHWRVDRFPFAENFQRAVDSWNRFQSPP